MSNFVKAAAVAFGLFYVATQPAGAADVFSAGLGALQAVGSGTASFVTQATGG